ncbi:MAG TPA: YetF domain-containing protein [Herpetosiphonaceae bacterium]|nr:YetF domain-containing protein [Herpetosiphonaceae bacterium]
MGSILRGLAVYFFLLILFRVLGKRSLSQITTFDAVLLLIISEAIQQALIDNDNSMTNAFLVVTTLLGMNHVMQLITVRSQAADKLFNDVPLLLIDDGRVLQDRLKKIRVSEDDILEQGREMFGLERMEQIKYAVLERGGHITVIPRRVSWAAPPVSDGEEAIQPAGVA